VFTHETREIIVEDMIHSAAAAAAAAMCPFNISFMFNYLN
jgi:hypothetical protein